MTPADQIGITTLDNGLRVVTDPMAGVATASLGVWLGTGTRQERPEDNGIAHLLEHMSFKGTAKRSAQDIAEEIEAVGGHLNAYTSRENTAYYAKVLAEDLPLALDILSDILQHPTFDPEELARERTVVLQEIGQAHDTPDDIIFDHFQAVAYPDQPLGRPVLGSADSVRRLTRESLTHYVGQQYAAGAMVLSAAGAVEHAALVDAAAKAFDAIPARPDGATDTAQYAGGDYREARDLEQLHLILGFEGLGYHDEDFYAAAVLSTLLGGGMSSRLFQEIREKRGLVYSIYSFTGHYRDTGLFGIYAGTGGEDAPELVPVLCDELLQVTETVSDKEIARARAQIRSGLLMGLESTMMRCEQLGQNLLTHGRPLPVDEQVEKVAAVDGAAVRRVARRLFASRPTLAALGPIEHLDAYDRVADRLRF